MKTKICLLGFFLTFSVSAGAALYSFGALDSQSALGAIPDNNTIGLTESLTASETESSISDLTLTIQLQNGSATDLSGYLRLGNATDSPYYNLTSLIQAQTLSAGSPTTFSINFTTPTYGSGFSTAFNNRNPNDPWTLFFADNVAGDTTTLNGWSLDITTAPEPANVALGVFGGMACLIGGLRWQLRRNHALK